MSVSIQEQETTISFSRDGEYADIYTSDTTMMTKFDKLAENTDAPDWECIEEVHDQCGSLCAKIYRTKKKLISARATVVTRELTEEQRQELSDRLRAVRNRQKSDIQEEKTV